MTSAGTSDAASMTQQALNPTARNWHVMVERIGTAQPVQILRTKDDHSFELDKEALRSILQAGDVKDKPVVVVSVVGPYRKGKSFLLNFFLRYMHSQCRGDWLGDHDVHFGGFSWRGGCERETTGILLWGEIFLVSTTEGEQLAVLFMDTQGAFDCESTVKESATIFALSAMTSSIVVYNVSQDIQEDCLQHLQLFMEYGRLAQQGDSEKAFQKLLFLVRDWSYPFDFMYGAEGGRSFIDARLQISDRQPGELQKPRRHIKSCFTEIDCFLMPHPGVKLATSRWFEGRLSDVEDDFKKHLQELVPSLLAPENLLVKKINGKNISCQELVTYFQVYINTFKGDTLPQPMSMLEATAKANNLAAMAAAREKYTKGMEERCGGNQPYMNHQELVQYHLWLREEARQSFSATPKMGGEELSQPYLEELTQDIDQMFENFARQNDHKNTFAAVRTPLTLLKLVLGFYLLYGTSALVGLYAFAKVCNQLMNLSLISLVLWLYVRYIGDMPTVGALIDTIANVIWATVLKLVLLYKIVTRHRVRAADAQHEGRW